MEPKKNLIRTLGISFGIIVVLFIAIWYVKAQIDENLLLVQRAQADMQAREVSLSDLAVLQADAEKAKQYIPALDMRFTNKDQLLIFSTDISFLAKQAGFVGTPRFKEETAPPSGDLQKVNFSLLLEGQKNFSDLSSFFRLVEQSNYFVRFTSLDVSREGDALRLNANGYVLAFQ